MPQAPIRRRLVLGASLIACAVPAALQAQTPDAQANGYPQRPIKLLVGIGAGSTTDQLARIAARHLSDVLKQPVVVDNRPGAGGTLGAAAVASAPADGYTLLFTSSSLPTFGYFYDNLKFNPVKDRVGAGSLAQGGMALLTRANAPWKNLGELVADSKKRGAGAITYASAGIGSIAYLYSELLAQTAGIELLHVPYKSSAAALTDLLAGQVDVVFDGTTTAKAQLDAGLVRALAYSTGQRSSFLPDVPTMQEAGVNGFAQRTWFGISVPAKTPAGVVERLSAATLAVNDLPAFRKELAAAAHEPMKMEAAQFEQLIQGEYRQWGAIIPKIPKRAN